MHMTVPLRCSAIVCLVLGYGVTESLSAADNPTTWTRDDLTRLTARNGVLDLSCLAAEITGKVHKKPLTIKAVDLQTPGGKTDAGLSGRLAVSLAQALATVKPDASPQKVLSQVSDILAIRKWCMHGAGYGNLLLAYQCEETALRLLFPLLVQSTPSLSEMQRLLQRLRSETPTCEQWLAVLRTEQVPEIVSKADLEGLPEYKSLAILFENLQNSDPELIKAVPLLAGGSELPASKLYPDCLQAPRLPQLAWNAFLLAFKNNSLSLLLEYMEKAGPLPKKEEVFRRAVKKVLGSQLRSRERLGGRMDSGGLWTVYKLAVLSPKRK